MLARRFTAEREDYAYIESCSYGTGYLDLLRVRRVLAVCQALGIRPDKPSETVRMENMEVSYQDVTRFLNTASGLKNAFTLSNKAYRVHMYLETQAPGAMLVDELLLHQQLNHMLSDVLISERNRDPVAVRASQMSRVELSKELRTCSRSG